MSNLPGLGMAFVFGSTLGALYLALLWYSVKLVTGRRRHTLLFAAGGLVRITAVLIGMYAVLKLGDWRHAVSAIAGFALMRGLVSLSMATRHKPPADQGG